ncbi:HpcH/HpaI aldolase family protein [Edaphobacter sp.]|uniref:HpcH/HpaI aldolase family protein n=1 Tax=Edaphobacter sp. TaxID=1934404 RepID=UPI002DB8686E|nr:aldolase/citrate lyase family protein [Edaphobacter sp.]HEU5340166.1 aldolase/citrate lyase family protein [Edaphobacter sp.]
MNRLLKATKAQTGSPILGAAAYSYDPIFIEVAARMGYRAAWIEMEHGFITFAEAADLCRIASGLGMVTMVRIPDARRENVLKAAECGPDIIDLPMANSAKDLEQLVRFAKFRPLGERGFFSVSRALEYGIDVNISDAQQQLNGELCLMAQIETVEALEKAEEICSVPGVDIFIGPADLSASLDVPGQTGHSKVYAAAGKAIRIAKSHGKLVAVGSAPEDFEFYVSQGVDLLFCTNNIAAMKIGAQTVMKRALAAMEKVVT